MPYTIADWIREHARIRVRLPSSPGHFRECWLPLDVLTGEIMPPNEAAVWGWVDHRTHPGEEWVDFWAFQALAETREGSEARGDE